jgi:hypothetical protein
MTILYLEPNVDVMLYKQDTQPRLCFDVKTFVEIEDRYILLLFLRLIATCDATSCSSKLQAALFTLIAWQR